MIQVTQKDLMPGVHLTAVHTEKFKTCLLGATLLTSLRKETASLNALVPFVLRRGTERAPDMEALSAALDELYGGSIEPNVRKKGSVQCIGFTGSFLDDTYTPGREAILEPAAALLGDLLLHPVKEDGGFRREYVEGERANLVDRIRAQVNDKRQYSVQKLIQLVCAGEPAGVDKLGDESSALPPSRQTACGRRTGLCCGRPCGALLLRLGSAGAGRGGPGRRLPGPAQRGDAHSGGGTVRRGPWRLQAGRGWKKRLWT